MWKWIVEYTQTSCISEKHRACVVDLLGLGNYAVCVVYITTLCVQAIQSCQPSLCTSPLFHLFNLKNFHVHNRPRRTDNLLFKWSQLSHCNDNHARPYSSASVLFLVIITCLPSIFTRFQQMIAIEQCQLYILILVYYTWNRHSKKDLELLFYWVNSGALLWMNTCVVGVPRANKRSLYVTFCAM